jgi:indolepyruvate ferredoxin oxidoreductase alpha subunit
MLLRRTKPRERFRHQYCLIDNDTCKGCRMCLEINCPAISWLQVAGTAKDGHKRKGTAFINKDQCVGCEVCYQICEFEGIVPQE